LRAELGIDGRRRGGAGADATDRSVVAAGEVLDQIAVEMDRSGSPLALGTDDVAQRITRGQALLGGRPLGVVGTAAFDQLVDALRANARDLRAGLRRPEISDRVRLWRGVLELVAASLAGIARDDVLWHGFSALDEEDLRDWLGRHGASEETLARSPVLRGLYDLTFAYRGGDKHQPSLAAGKGLQSLLMMINYEGSFMWRMRAGMGDVVFAPLYLALKERGVRFQFFSRITRLRLTPGRPMISGIELVREATVGAGAERYEPIKRIGGWWCWPAILDQEQLRDSEPHAQTLMRGVDFDHVVLAIPVGALSEICVELAEANPRFKQMLDGAETVRTKAFQVWLTRPIDALRAARTADSLDPPTTAYAEPFDTYCDMSHLLEAEGYGAGDGPRGLAYFCAVLPDSPGDHEAEESVRAGALRYLEQKADAIWPAAFNGGQFDWSVVFDPLGREGPDRMAAQYFRANVAPTDRYVTTPAGSVDSRLDPERSGFENLVLAGDWTHNGIDGGCVEAAVISGERAAYALVAGSTRGKPGVQVRSAYVEYGALATAPGPLVCERARLYCFLVQTDRARVQRLCDRVLKQPTGGALRYRVPRLYPVILTFGTIAGLRSMHPAHAGRGSASEPEAAIWVPTIAQRFEAGQYVDDHLAIFMPYIWVDDPIAFASGREVYGFAKTQGWMRRLGDPRMPVEHRVESGAPDPPAELVLDVYGAPEYDAGSELSRHRLITIRGPAGVRRGLPPDEYRDPHGEGVDLQSLVGYVISELDPTSAPQLGAAAHRSLERVQRRLGGFTSRVTTMSELLSEQVVRLVFLKQVRDAEHGDLAALQQVVEARSSVTPGSLRWRRLRGSYELSVNPLASHPLEDELGLRPDQTITLAFGAEFGFRMDAGTVRWPSA
jgi:uncharacterized protein with NAD-binding domain and iron-sulfur cluster